MAALSVGLCGVLALTAYADPLAVAAGIAVAQLVLAGAVYQGPAVPAPRTAWIVVAAGGLAATAFTVWPDLLTGFAGSHAGDSARVSGGTLVGVGPAAAIVVLGAMVREMLRQGRRTALTASVATTVMLGVSATLLAAWVAASKTDQGDQILLVAATAVAGAALVWSLPGPRPLIGPLAVLAGIGAAMGVRVLLIDPLELATMSGLAAVAAVLTTVGRAIARTLASDPTRRLAVEAVLPLVFVGPIAFWVGQLFV